mgnify:CR=1 FL=1
MLDSSSVTDLLFVFMLAAFLGFQLIKRVSPLLHSPLMSLTNAIAAVVVVGAALRLERACLVPPPDEDSTENGGARPA